MFLRNHAYTKARLKQIIEIATFYRVRWHLPPGNFHKFLITFDDGPCPNTLQILPILRKYRIKGIFFMVAERMLQYPDIVRQVISDGHTIASHGLRHVVMKNLNLKDFRLQVLQSFAIIKKFAGNQPKWFRPPQGLITPLQLAWLVSSGFEVVFWSHQLGGNENLMEVSPKINKLGAIILLHDFDETHTIEPIIESCNMSG